jgi:hypothetical protein
MNKAIDEKAPLRRDFASSTLSAGTMFESPSKSACPSRRIGLVWGAPDLEDHHSALFAALGCE